MKNSTLKCIIIFLVYLHKLTEVTLGDDFSVIVCQLFYGKTHHLLFSIQNVNTLFLNKICKRFKLVYR